MWYRSLRDFEFLGEFFGVFRDFEDFRNFYHLKYTKALKIFIKVEREISLILRIIIFVLFSLSP
jgi:hypothetical protein